MSGKDLGLPPWMHFVIGGSAGISGWLFVHPMDVLKVRMQLLGESAQKMSLGSVCGNIMKQEGIAGFYRGLSAAVTRQATYTALRLGLYPNIRDAISKPGEDSFAKKGIAGILAGGTAMLISCPIEVALVRMQADGRLPLAERRGYTHVFNALARIGKEEGALTYWRGATPTVLRAMVVSLTQLATYDQAKFLYKKSGFFSDGVPLHLTASTTSGFIYSLASLPLDTAKTRMQSQKPGPDGKLLYNSTMGTLGRIVRNEGFFSLWKGFLPYFARSGGHTIMMFLFLEQYNKLACQAFNKPASPAAKPAVKANASVSANPAGETTVPAATKPTSTK